MLRSQDRFRALFFAAVTLLIGTSSSQEPNKCNTEVLPNKNRVVVSWSINVGKLTPDSYTGICFGKVHSDSLVTILCWDKTTKAFSFSSHFESSFSRSKANKFKKPQATEHLDGSVTVSVEMPLTKNVGQMVFWDVQWGEKMHNRVIDEMLYCTYRVESSGCGTKSYRTVWGTKTKPGEWPWQVSLKHRHKGHYCGGSLIGPRWVLTATHCFDGHNQKDFSVVVGEHHLYTTDGFEQEVSIKRLYKHPRYNMSSINDYDTALLELDKAIQYNDRVLPVCLPESDFASGTKCFVTGWGKTEISVKQRHKVLKQAKVPLVSRISCKRSYKDWQSLGYRVTKRMRCSGYPKGGPGACQSDNGGPLVCERNRKWYLLGVLSWGAGCGQEGGYGVHADVLKLKKWIQKTMQAS